MIGRNLKEYMSMSRSIMVVFASAECGNDEPQTNADGRDADACAEKKEQKAKRF